MAQQNRWQLGVPYSFLLNGTPFFTQPGGPFTAVFPAPPNNQPWPEWPIAGMIIGSTGSWWRPGCLHQIDMFRIIAEYDYNLNIPVSLVTCNVCTYVQRVVSAVDGASAGFNSTGVYNPYQNAIIVG